MHWLIGLSVSLIVGWLTSSTAIARIREFQTKNNSNETNTPRSRLLFYLGLEECPKSPTDIRMLPPAFVGFLERLFFTFIVAFEISGASVAMVGWITVKLANFWSPWARANNADRGDESTDFVPFLPSALIGNLISMFFALVGGLICRGC